MVRLTIASLLVSAALAAPAFAGSITFDLGNAGHLGSQTSASETLNSAGVFQGGGWVTFTNSGVSISAAGFMLSGCNSEPSCMKYVTQKPGSFGPNETGIGESNFQNSQSDGDREVTSTTALILDNTAAINAGYTESQLVLESLQAGEGVYVYGFNDLNSGSPALLDTLIGCSAPNCTGGATQFSIALQNWKYFGLTAIPSNANGGGSNDFVLSEDIISAPKNVPEPLTIAIFGAGLAGLGAMRRRKRA